MNPSAFCASISNQMVELYEADGETEDQYTDFDLRQALNSLDPLDKTVVVLRFFEGMQLNQIAEAMDENLNTVKSRLYRSLKKLKLSLAKEGVDSI